MYKFRSGGSHTPSEKVNDFIFRFYLYVDKLILELFSTDCSSPLLMQVDEELRVEEVEIYYDPGEFLAGLIKGPLLSSTGEVESHATSTVTATNPTQNTCPFTRSE